jgi:hypothetical protein
VSGQRHALTALQERTPVPIGYEAGWASELVWIQRLEEKYFASAGHRALVVQSVVRISDVFHVPSISGNVVTYMNYNVYLVYGSDKIP